MLALRPLNNPVLSALSALLSQRERAPEALTPKLVSDLAERLDLVLQTLAKSQNYRVLFKNTLLALTGLLRYREIEPWALVRDRSQSAEDLAKTLERIQGVLENRTQQVPQGAKKLAIVKQLIELLSGSGGDPNILRQINELSDDDADA